MSSIRCATMFIVLALVFCSSLPGQQTDDRLIPVVVANQLLNQGTVLDQKHFVLQQWPQSLVPENTANDISDLVGKRTTVRLFKGVPVLLHNVQDQPKHHPLNIPPGKLVLSLKLAPNILLKELFEQGDQVDVIAILPLEQTGGVKSKATRTILKDATVFSLVSPTRNTNQIPDATHQSHSIAGLLVDRAQAESLVLAQSNDEFERLVLVKPNATREIQLNNNVQSATDANQLNDKDHQIVRNVAKKLDQLAADLEDLKMFDRADGLRETAQQLRVELRSSINK